MVKTVLYFQQYKISPQVLLVQTMSLFHRCFQTFFSVNTTTWFLHKWNISLTKAIKIIGLIRKLKLIIAKTVLLTICKSFLNPHLDYGHVIYDRAFEESFQNNSQHIFFSIFDIKTSKTLFFCPLLLCGIGSIIIIEIRNLIMLLKNNTEICQTNS